MKKLRLQVCMVIALVAGATSVRALGPEQTAENLAGHNASPSTATRISPLKITLTRSKIIASDGRERTATADFAKPGDILEDTATYTNVSNTPLLVKDATLPVPLNTVLQVASLRPLGAKASLDGRTFETLPIRRQVQQPGASRVEADVDPAAYRFVRWTPGEIGPGKAVVFSARFKVVGEIVAADKTKD